MSRPASPVIVTRAQPGALETALRLEKIGLAAILSPVLIMQERSDVNLPGAETLSGLVFTSANGVRAYSAQRSDRTLPAWCVGPATATAAREAGHQSVHESAGNAADLAEFITRNSAPESKPLLHVANAAARGDLKQVLKSHGFQTIFAPLYDMRPAGALSDAAQEVLSGDTPCLVLIHSEKAARRFVDLCEDQALRQVGAVVISESAAQPLNVLDLNTLQTAPQPNEDGLFQALEAALATLSA